MSVTVLLKNDNVVIDEILYRSERHRTRMECLERSYLWEDAIMPSGTAMETSQDYV